MSRYPKMAKSAQTWKGFYQNSRSCCSSADSAGRKASIGCFVHSPVPQLEYSPLSAPTTRNFSPQLVKLAAELQIADRVRILPRTVIGAEKERLFAAAHLFVLPSYSENFGNTVLEAMRRGLPIVVTPEVGAAEIVRTSGAGLVVAGDMEPLSSAIRLLTADPILARSMGEAGRGHAAAHFTWDHVAAQMEDLYNSVGPE